MESEELQDMQEIDKAARREVGRRLVTYASLYKPIILSALLLLMLAVAADLGGPFIAKRLIDNHILGIEKTWYEVPGANAAAGAPLKEGNAGAAAAATDGQPDSAAATDGQSDSAAAADGSTAKPAELSGQANDPYAVQFQDKVYKRGDRFEAGEPKGPEMHLLQIGMNFALVEGEMKTTDGKRAFTEGGISVGTGEDKAVYPAVKLTQQEVLGFYKPELAGVLKLIALFVVLSVAAAIFHYGQRYLLQTSANRIVQRMRNDLYKQISRLPVRFFDNLPAGKIVARITNDTEAIRDLFVQVLANLASGFMYMAGIFIALFFLDVKLAFLCLILIPVIAVWVKLYRKVATKYNHIVRTRISDINGTINESIQGMTIIQAFNRQKRIKGEFEDLNTDCFTNQNKLLNLDALASHNLVGVFRNLTFIALIWYFGGASLGIGAAISIGSLYAFVDFINRLFHPVQQIISQLSVMEQSLVSADRVFEILDEPGDDVDYSESARYKGNVAFENVYFAYKDKEYVLKNINFEAKQGQTVALVGHTGSGKSSIMNLLFRYYDVNLGRVTIDGTDIREMPRQHLRHHMGIVLQDPFLFTGTIASNVSLDDPRITREMVEKAMADVGGGKLFRGLANGYDEPVLEKGSTLSAGQRQLISFARALAFDPAILILDEATANIDTETEAAIQEALEVLKKGRTTFIIAHRLSTIRSADQILVLDQGEIVEKGNHEELLRLGGRYSQMYRMQQAGA